jgi:hypothetical protein
MGSIPISLSPPCSVRQGVQIPGRGNEVRVFIVQMVRTLPFHGRYLGSIPNGDKKDGWEKTGEKGQVRKEREKTRRERNLVGSGLGEDMDLDRLCLGKERK